MAIINPTYEDFKNNQERALDYKEYRSSWNIIKASSYYFKVATRAENLENFTNAIGTGLEIDAWHQDDNGTEKLHIRITKGTCIKDNQVIIFKDDFEFIYDIPSQTTTYNIYIRYKYIDEFPPNAATIDIIAGDNPSVTDEFLLIGKVTVDPSNVVVGDSLSGIVIDTSARDALVVDVHVFNANNILGGDQNTIVYQTDTDHTGFILAPTSAGQRLTWDGNNFIWDTINNVPNAEVAQCANNLAGGDANKIPVQSSSNTTSFIEAPSANDQFLFWDGAIFTWRNLTDIPEASHANCADNLTGGNANEIPVQTEANQTSFIPAPSSSAYLYFDGTAFVWNSNIEKAENVCGGNANEILVQTNTDQTGFISAPTVSNTFLKWDGSTFVWESNINAIYADCAGAILGGDANQIVYQTSSDNTSFIPAPSTANVFLSWDGSQFTWSPTTVAEANHAICADCTTNMTGGAPNQILYQIETDHTGFIDAPTGDDQYLTFDTAAGQYKWVTLNVDTATIAQCACNIVGGNTYEIPVQTGVNQTSFISAPSSADSFLKWDGNNFVWDALAVGTVDLAQCACNLAGGSIHQILVQTGSSQTSFISAPAASNTFLKWDGNTFVWTTINSVSYASCAQNLAGGDAHQLPIQTGANQTSFISAPISADQVLYYDGSAVNWKTTSSITVGKASDLDISASNQILVQVNSTTTDVLPPPSASGQFLSWDGSNYVWASSTVSTAECARNLLGNYSCALVYQRSNNCTDFLSNPGASTKYLKWNGSAFVWDDVGQALTACSLSLNGNNQIVFQSGTTSCLVPSPSADKYLKWTGTAYIWDTPAASTATVALCACNLIGSTSPAVVVQTGNNATGFSEAADSANSLRTQFLYYDTGANAWKITKSSTSAYVGSVNIYDSNTGNYRTLRVATDGNQGRYPGSNDWSNASGASVSAAIHGHASDSQSIGVYGTSGGYGMYGVGGVGGIYGASENGAGIVANSSNDIALRAYSFCGQAAYMYSASTTDYAVSVYGNCKGMYLCTEGEGLCVSASTTAGDFYSENLYGIRAAANNPTSGTAIVANGNFYSIYSDVGPMYINKGACFTNCVCVISDDEYIFYACSSCWAPIVGRSTYRVGVMGHAQNTSYGVYGKADTCIGVYGEAASGYAVAGNTDYGVVSDSDVKFLCDICVQQCLIDHNIKVYRYTFSDSNLKSHEEFIGPTAQDIEEVFNLQIDGTSEIIVPFEKAHPEVKEPAEPKKPENYVVDWKAKLDNFSLKEIKTFEQYEQDTINYRKAKEEYIRERKRYYANPIVTYKSTRYTVDGIAFALANENFQCILGHNEEIRQLKDKIAQLETTIASLQNNDTSSTQ